MLWAGQSQPTCNSIGQGSSDLLSFYFALGFAFRSTRMASIRSSVTFSGKCFPAGAQAV